MKNVMMTLVLVLFVQIIVACTSCSSATSGAGECSMDTLTPDLMPAAASAPTVGQVDSMPLVIVSQEEAQIQTLHDSIELLQSQVNSLTEMNAALADEIYWDARHIEKIKYYMGLCEKNKSQRQFLYGWIRRTLDDDDN